MTRRRKSSLNDSVTYYSSPEGSVRDSGVSASVLCTQNKAQLQQSRRKLLRKKSSHYSEDMTVFLAKDKKQKDRKEFLRRAKYQSITFFLCFSKLYYISLLQGVITFNRQEFNSLHTDLRIAFLVGLLVIGNIIDNIPSPKFIAIALQLTLAIVWTATGLMVAFISEEQKRHPEYLPDE